jgi:arylsulfatase A-like enzyme
LLHIPGTDILDPTITTWAQRLQTSGYVTASIGKWHLSDNPVPYGFDVNIAGTRSGGPPGGYYPPHPKAPGLQDAEPDEYLTDRLTDEAIKFIRQHSAKPSPQPWAVYLTHFAVHTPLDAKRQLVEKYRQKTPGQLHSHVAMATMIQAVDDGVGKLQATLEELGQQDNTVLIFYSDNGGYGPATDMHPLKGYKGTYYEGGIRVPCFVKWPGVVLAGTQSSEPIIAVDLYPTLCEIAGTSLPPDQPIDGISLVPLLNGSQSTFGSRPLFWHFPAYLESYAVTDEQRDPLFRSRPCSIMRQGPWKLHQYFEDNGLELYHLTDDPGETRNLAQSEPKKTAELLQTLQTWQTSVQAAIPSQPNPDYDAAAEARAMTIKRNRR